MSGSDVKRLRLAMRLTQVEFARKLGVNPRTINRYELEYSAQPLKILRRLEAIRAKVFGPAVTGA
jgi:transcriptional regulator with XRE-family HTH domain